MKFKAFIIIIILLISLFCLTGCYDISSVETLAYVVAIGIDKNDNNTIRLTMQFAVPTDAESASSSQASSSTLFDVKCSTIDEGISLINSYISKKVNLSHCKAIIFSEDIASQGISDYIYNLVNNVQFRPDCYIIISRCDAKYFLNNSIPTLESIPARYYELIFNSSEYTGYTDPVTLSDFYENILSTTSQPIAILGGVNNASAEKDASISTNISNGYKANDTPFGSENKTENIGLAVFNNDTLVGELNNLETLCHMIVSGKLVTATLTIPSPFEYTDNISLIISLVEDTKRDVKIIGDYPYITCNISVNGYVLNVDNDIDLTKEETINLINEAVQNYLTYSVSSYLYKTAKEFNSDIDGFGKYVAPNYLTLKDWEKADWLSNYKNSFFNVSVDANIISGHLFNKF